jgi:hypothetical protein
VSRTNRSRFLATRAGLADRDTGLEWAAGPATPAVDWAEAAATADSRGQRLPTAEELLILLTGLPPAPGMPDTGEALWSTSGSPFAPETRVRAVACDGATRFIVVLLDRTARARWWGVWRQGSIANGAVD